MQRKDHMGAAIVERHHVVAIGQDEYCPARRADRFAAGTELGERADVD